MLGNEEYINTALLSHTKSGQRPVRVVWSAVRDPRQETPGDEAAVGEITRRMLRTRRPHLA